MTPRDGAIVGVWVPIRGMRDELLHVALFAWVDGADLCMYVITRSGHPSVLRFPGMVAQMLAGDPDVA